MSMFKMPSPGKCHSNTKFIAGINYLMIADAATRFNNIFYSVFIGCFNAVAERKKCIGNKYRIFKIHILPSN
jgi:hypothetical protein